MGSKSNLISTAKNIFSTKKFSLRSKDRDTGKSPTQPDEGSGDTEEKPQIKTNKFTSSNAPKTSQSSMAFYPGGSQSPKTGASGAGPSIRTDNGMKIHRFNLGPSSTKMTSG